MEKKEILATLAEEQDKMKYAVSAKYHEFCQMDEDHKHIARCAAMLKSKNIRLPFLLLHKDDLDKMYLVFGERSNIRDGEIYYAALRIGPKNKWMSLPTTIIQSIIDSFIIKELSPVQAVEEFRNIIPKKLKR